MSDPRPPWELYQRADATTAPPWEAYRREAPTSDEEAFPTPLETAGTMVQSGLRAIPAMAMGTGRMMAETIAPLVLSRPQALAGQSMEHLGRAFSSEDTGDSYERLGHAVSAVPVVGPAAVGLTRAAGQILSPAVTTATKGAGHITPTEMKQAAEAGGSTVAALALPGAAKGVSKLTPSGAAKILRFAVTGGIRAPGTALAKKIIGDFVVKPAMRRMGTILQDAIYDAVSRGRVADAAEAVAKAAEKSPEVAQALAESAAKVDVPPIPKVPTAPPVPLPPIPQIPVPKGQSRLPTIYTKPKTASMGKPLSPKQRDLQREQFEAAAAQGLDIWDVFGGHAAKTAKAGAGKTGAASALTKGPAGTEMVQVVGPKGDRVVITVKRDFKGASDFDPLTPAKAGKHELQADKITRRVGDGSWQAQLEALGYTPDEILGFAHFGPGGAKLRPGMVYVSPELQRQGIATAMYDAARSASGKAIGLGSLRPSGVAFRRAYDKRKKK